MSNDTITTILGATGAAITAAQPVVNASQGALHQQDYVQIALAVIMAIFGFFTNKGASNG